MSKHGGCNDLRTYCTEEDVYVGQGLQTGRTENDLRMPIHTQNPNSQRLEYSHSISPLTFIQGKPGEPGNDGVRGPKGSHVSLYCLHNPVVVTERIHEVIFFFVWARSL